MRTALKIAAVVCLYFVGDADAAQDQQHYEKAISDNSTSHYFVLVTLIDDKTGRANAGCVAANLLIGAIFIENGGAFDQTGNNEQRKATIALLDRARNIAIKNTAHEFHFSNHAAFANIPIEYTQEDLESAREAVEAIGLEHLMAPSPTEKQSLGKLHWSAALACAIIERGASARRADITGEIYAMP